MIKSMTGFASLTREDEAGSIGVTVRAVNHRYLDLQFRLPPPLAELESRLRAVAQARLARGRVEVTLSLQRRTPQAVEVEINEPLLDALGAAIKGARDRGLVNGTLTPSDLLRMPQAIAFREAAAEDEAERAALAAVIESVVDEAIAGLDAMRTREGGYLRADLESRRTGLAALIDRIAAESAAGQEAVKTRLVTRVKEMTEDLHLEPDMLVQEVVRFAARSDISEEISRFRGHLAHWLALAEGPEPCGRKLDFLLQEMNREINTIGSKAEGGGLAELVVESKAELEKMREQVQNVE